MNWLLLGAVLAAVFAFGSSSSLASAYGVAVMGTMLATTFLTFFVIRFGWGYPLWLCVAATGVFMLVDLAFFAAALNKVRDGGWFPLALGAAVFTMMMTWRRGRQLLLSRLREGSVPLQPFLQSLFREPPRRVPGTAVFMTATPEATPHALLHSLKHYKVLHERIVFLTVELVEVPLVAPEDRLRVERLRADCVRVFARYGFMERPDVMRALEGLRVPGFELDPMEASFFLSREKVVPARGGRRMPLWRERLFSAMARNAGSIADFFNIPPNRVVELGTRIEI